MLLRNIFPLSDQTGADTSAIQTSKLHLLAQVSIPVSDQELLEMLEQHHLFLSSGGMGGKWQTLLIKGLVIGDYIGAEGKEGKQASLERRRFSEHLILENIELPFANFCGIYAKDKSFVNVDFSYSLMTDVYLDSCNFNNANLQGVDFSRSILRNVSFHNANLQGADFENCDLTGANFEGTKMEGARFPGAILNQVKY